jgi:hypothetical protein
LGWPPGSSGFTPLQTIYSDVLRRFGNMYAHMCKHTSYCVGIGYRWNEQPTKQPTNQSEPTTFEQSCKPKLRGTPTSWGESNHLPSPSLSLFLPPLLIPLTLFFSITHFIGLFCRLVQPSPFNNLPPSPPKLGLSRCLHLPFLVIPRILLSP